MNNETDEEYILSLLNIKNREALYEMKKYIQHGSTTTYDHSVRVACKCIELNRRFNLHADERRLAEIGMLHDLYLYDWHVPSDTHRLHGFYHPRKAADNARRIYNIDDKSYRSILTHMWPLTITRVPNGKEAWILCICDKIVSTAETLKRK